ncbi:MAG: YdeI/OmpD-associated family protein [Prolixibacteraceae bacterium]|nr:YdeI/OmpD-associated family protein [Prolixibacteraceae bacterium]
MKEADHLYFSERKEWKSWLQQYYNDSKGIWLVFYKKETGKPTMEYDDAVEEALCFGWIDGIIKKLDNERYVRKFMPRINFYNWSPTNRKRAEKMIAEGKMTSAGLNKIGDYAKTGKLIWPEYDKSQIPNEFAPNLYKMLCQNKQASQNFRNLSPSHQKRYLMWVMSAKTQETRLKRMKEAVDLLEKNIKNLNK